MRKSSLMLATVFVAGLAVAARAAESNLVDGQVPFEFTAGSARLPAGHYEILAADDNDQVLIVRNLDTRKATLVEYMTRIASREDDKSTLVFDKSGGARVLSEVHVAGSDGYLLTASKKAHKQVKAS